MFIVADIEHFVKMWIYTCIYVNLRSNRFTVLLFGVRVILAEAKVLCGGIDMFEKEYDELYKTGIVPVVALDSPTTDRKSVV